MDALTQIVASTCYDPSPLVHAPHHRLYFQAGRAVVLLESGVVRTLRFPRALFTAPNPHPYFYLARPVADLQLTKGGDYLARTEDGVVYRVTLSGDTTVAEHLPLPAPVLTSGGRYSFVTTTGRAYCYRQGALHALGGTARQCVWLPWSEEYLAVSPVGTLLYCGTEWAETTTPVTTVPPIAVSEIRVGEADLYLRARDGTWYRAPGWGMTSLPLRSLGGPPSLSAPGFRHWVTGHSYYATALGRHHEMLQMWEDHPHHGESLPLLVRVADPGAPEKVVYMEFEQVAGRLVCVAEHVVLGG